MNRNKQEKIFKELLALEREYDKLLEKKWSIAPVKLDKPIAHGFVRTLHIRPEYLIRGDYPTIKYAFEYIGYRPAYCKHKSFIIKHKNHTEEKHARLSWKADPRFRCFRTDSLFHLEQEKIEKCGGFIKYVDKFTECACSACHCKPNQFVPHYEFKKPWLLEEKTNIYWLTHCTPIDSDLESQLAYLRKKFETIHVWEKIHGRNKDFGYDDTFIPLKVEAHAYLHGYPRPRIDDLYD